MIRLCSIPLLFAVACFLSGAYGALHNQLVVLCTTIVFGMMALLIAYLTVEADTTAEFVFRSATISDPAAFRRAGAMHNASYLGGLVGIFTGLASILRSFLAENSRMQVAESDGEASC